MTKPWLMVVVGIVALCGGCSRSRGAAGHRAVAHAFLPLAGMPPVIDRRDIYSEDRAGDLSPAVAHELHRIYVPNSGSNTVDEIDPRTFRIVAHLKVGRQPQHVTPSWDLKSLWVLNDLGDSLTRIDPLTGRKGKTIRVDDPYNMYYSPDGRYAIVVAERLHRLDFRNSQTMKLVHSVPVDCGGIDHMDFTADGRYLIGSCEFSGRLVKVDVSRQKVVGYLQLSARAMPQDVKASPDGTVFYVADMASNGVWLVEPDGFTTLGFVPTGKGTHGLYPSRDARLLYISNRAEGTISVLDFATRKLVARWVIPGGTPDMGGVSVDGKTLWLSGRYSREVYAIDTGDGRLLARIRVGKGPHGLCVWPQPGRYSLGHTGVLR